MYTKSDVVAGRVVVLHCLHIAKQFVLRKGLDVVILQHRYSLQRHTLRAIFAACFGRTSNYKIIPRESVQ